MKERRALADPLLNLVDFIVKFLIGQRHELCKLDIRTILPDQLLQLVFFGLRCFFSLQPLHIDQLLAPIGLNSLDFPNIERCFLVLRRAESQVVQAAQSAEV